MKQQLKLSGESANYLGFKGQYVLSKLITDLPLGWETRSSLGWHLAVNGLPIYELLHDSRFLGWCVGYPLSNELEVRPDEIGFSTFYGNTGGTFALLLVGLNKIAIDAFGSLPCVFHRDRGIVASSPLLIGGALEFDTELVATLGFPGRDTWFPFGLTAFRQIERLLPNHTLDISDWKSCRIWPVNGECDLVGADTDTLVHEIVAIMSRSLCLIAKNYPIEFTLTAGKDSRMVLAAARNIAAQSRFVTFNDSSRNRDVHISGLLAKKYNLDHRYINVIEANDAEREAWLMRTGFSVSGDILRICKTLELLDSSSALAVGIAGEVGRAYFWRAGDHIDDSISGYALLKRMSMPVTDRLVQLADGWLRSVAHFGLFNVLDLAYIEQRLASWAAPSRFGNIYSACEVSPFNHRRIFQCMMKLPPEFRIADQLPDAACRLVWPELLDTPFNRYTGARGLIDVLGTRLKGLIKLMIGRN